MECIHDEGDVVGGASNTMLLLLILGVCPAIVWYLAWQRVGLSWLGLAGSVGFGCRGRRVGLRKLACRWRVGLEKFKCRESKFEHDESKFLISFFSSHATGSGPVIKVITLPYCSKRKSREKGLHKEATIKGRI